ncbi:hypothetical protein ABENE_16340 [Asticcacaulis benevestitus DSM 16100 = ATCC BAA-896]|uniref:Uncharacterized protein n=1 Tax=Asticcacaulis benevestitus DSM 16100 = ATCC BAA-896 TaxID=1121022 RepID=V4P2B4_9CAUL|nr:hypothetical protein ABENE_16340 [Asticcacaulis benevestitus DSM 16100 = ATCC BAA-896]
MMTLKAEEIIKKERARLRFTLVIFLPSKLTGQRPRWRKV